MLLCRRNLDRKTIEIIWITPHRKVHFLERESFNRTGKLLVRSLHSRILGSRPQVRYRNHSHRLVLNEKVKTRSLNLSNLFQSILYSIESILRESKMYSGLQSLDSLLTIESTAVSCLFKDDERIRFQWV